MTKKLVLMGVFVAVATAYLYGAPQTSDSGSAAQTITGCLQKGNESQGYYLISSEDKHWELYPEGGVNLGEHVGHTVTVTGTEAHRTAAQEKKSQPSEKKEMGTKQHADLQVTNVKHVSDSCNK